MSLIWTQNQFCTATLIPSLCSVFTFHFDYCLPQSPHSLEVKSRTGNHVSSGMIDTYGTYIHTYKTFVPNLGFV